MAAFGNDLQQNSVDPGPVRNAGIGCLHQWVGASAKPWHLPEDAQGTTVQLFKKPVR
jgi:hypothetical protein